MIGGTAAVSKGKGKRIPLLSLSFVPLVSPANESISELGLKESASMFTTLTPSITLSRGYRPSSLSRAAQLDPPLIPAEEPAPKSPSKLLDAISTPKTDAYAPPSPFFRKTESYQDDEDASGILRSPVVARNRLRNPFLNGVPSDSGSPSHRTKTLMSELGSEFGIDWKANLEKELFGPEDVPDEGDADADEVASMRDELRISAGICGAGGESKEGEHQAISVDDGSMEAMNALDHALDPMRSGDPRASDEHILPLGCLRHAPAETFHLLAKAVTARPAVWIDSREAGRGGRERNLLVSGLGDAMKLPGARIRDATWNLYPDDDSDNGGGRDEKQEKQDEPTSPFVRRERALNRMDETHHRRVSSSGLSSSAPAIPMSSAIPRTPLPARPSPAGGSDASGAYAPTRQPLPFGPSESFFTSLSQPPLSSTERRAPNEDDEGDGDEEYTTEGSYNDDEEDKRNTVGSKSPYAHTSSLTYRELKSAEDEDEDQDNENK